MTAVEPDVDGIKVHLSDGYAIVTNPGDLLAAFTSVRAENTRLRAAVDAVRALHHRRDDLVHHITQQPICDGCGDAEGFASEYPCLTIRALTTHLPDDTKEA